VILPRVDTGSKRFLFDNFTFGYVAITLYSPAFQRVHLASGLVTLLTRSYNPAVHARRFDDFAPQRRYVMDTTLRHAVASVGDRKEPSFCGFATAGAEIGRPAYIVVG
jgi:hypothetical protein